MTSDGSSWRRAAADEGVGATLLTNIVMQVFVQGGDGKQDEDSECVFVRVRACISRSGGANQ